MFGFLRQNKKVNKPLSEMSTKEVGQFLSKAFLSTVRHDTYEPPSHKCSRWILVNGPAYADEGLVGSVLVEVPKLLDWMTSHASNVFSSNKAEQQAREYLPEWFRNADLQDESVTLLDKHQREVLQGDCLRFLWSDWAKVWCPICKTLHSRINEHDHGWFQTGRITLHFDDWHCPEGHLLNTERPLDIRWIVR